MIDAVDTAAEPRAKRGRPRKLPVSIRDVQLNVVLPHDVRVRFERMAREHGATQSEMFVAAVNLMAEALYGGPGKAVPAPDTRKRILAEFTRSSWPSRNAGSANGKA